MAYSWFRLESAIADHPKTMKLETALGEPLALAYIVRLLCWTHRYATSGFISRDLVPQMSRSVFREWADPDRAARAIQTMAQLRILDEETEGFWVHDWPEFQEALVKKSKRDAKNKRLKRRQRGAQTARAAHAPGTRAARLQDVTDETRRDDLDQQDPRISIVDLPTNEAAALVEFLEWKAATRRDLKLPVDCSPPPRTDIEDWWHDLFKRGLWPVRVKALYLAFLDDGEYRIGKALNLLSEADPPWPITAFARDWPRWDTFLNFPKEKR